MKPKKRALALSHRPPYLESAGMNSSIPTESAVVNENAAELINEPPMARDLVIE
jgi:hypothetical protein